jgi:hypothetical protein
VNLFLDGVCDSFRLLLMFFFLILLNLSYQDFVFVALEVSSLRVPASRISFSFLFFYASVIVYFFLNITMVFLFFHMC